MKRAPGVILLIPSAREFDRGLRRGIVEYAQTYGPWTFHEEPPAYLQPLTARQRLRSMRAWQADGVILLQDRLAEVKALGIPMVVSIGTHRLGNEFHQIVGDNEGVGRMGAAHLFGLGLRHFAYCGLRGLEFSDERARGFTQAIQDAGYEAHVYSSATHHLGQSWYTEQQQLKRWLTSLPKPVGLMACNDDRARMLGQVCRAQKIRVPDAIAILGVDNDEQVCKGANPPLSSIALAVERAGYEAAALLHSLMKRRKRPAYGVTVHPTHVVSRQSTDTLAIDDPVVVSTIRFIRDNSNKDIRVPDLAHVSGISRRALQDRFKRYLGRTPMEEIHRCRVDRLARLLSATNMTVGEIAGACGFEMDAHVSRFFSRHAGVTPLEYRRQHRVP